MLYDDAGHSLQVVQMVVLLHCLCHCQHQSHNGDVLKVTL